MLGGRGGVGRGRTSRSAEIGLEDDVVEAVRFQPVGMGVEGGAGRSGRILVVVPIGLLGRGGEPVPVEHGHRPGLAGLGVPSQQVVVMGADLARPVLVANLMIIGLGKGQAQQPEGQQGDPQ